MVHLAALWGKYFVSSLQSKINIFEYRSARLLFFLLGQILNGYALQVPKFNKDLK